MGGKTVTLKTTAFNLLLGLSGCFVCAQSASLPCVDHIFFISDDLQDVNRGLSTFGAEILYFQEIFSYLKDSQGILFIDEFARGTNPQEGQILIRSLCHFLHRQTVISFISTHYDNVGESSMSHYQVIGLRNMDFQHFRLPSNLNSQYSVDLIQDNMDYRIEKVDATRSVPRDALNIARILGFEEEIITYALQLYKGEKKFESSSTK